VYVCVCVKQIIEMAIAKLSKRTTDAVLIEATAR
jgi:hypothetical protein